VSTCATNNSKAKRESKKARKQESKKARKRSKKAKRESEARKSASERVQAKECKRKSASVREEGGKEAKSKKNVSSVQYRYLSSYIIDILVHSKIKYTSRTCEETTTKTSFSKKSGKRTLLLNAILLTF